MIPRRAALVAALPLLAGCASLKKIGTDTVCFDAVPFAFGISDLQTIFNSMALFANRAAQAGLLTQAEMDVMVKAAEQAVLLFDQMKKQALNAKPIDQAALAEFLAKLALIAAKLYGIPVPAGAKVVQPTRMMPLIP